jgi:O-antigen/teichoic acid export membrane protein
MSGVPEEPPPGSTKVDLTDLGTTDANTVLGGTAWSTITALVPPLQTLVVSVVAARFLGTEGFGQQSLIAFVSISCSYVLAARMPAALSRFGAQLIGAREPGMLHELYFRTIRSQIIVGALLLLAFGALAAAGADPSAAWVLAGFATFAAVIQAAPAALLTATQRWRENVLPGTITTLVASVVMIGVLAAGGGVAGYFAVDVAMVLANLLWTWRLARRISTRLPARDPIETGLRTEFRTFIRASTFFAVVEFVVLNRSEILFLNHFSTAAQVGFYSIAFAASEAVARFPAILTNVALPAVANLHGAGEHERIRNGYWRAVRFLAALCPPLVVAAAIFGSDLIGVVYGSKFVPAEPVVVILLVPYLLLPMAGLSDALLWTFGRIRFLVISGVVATVVDVGAALILVPSHDAIGAAIASDLGALTAGLPALWLVTRMMRPIHLGGRLLRNHLLVTLACGVCAAVPVVFLGGVPGLVVGIPASAAAVWFLGGYLGLLDRADGAWLDDATGHRLGGRIASLIRHFSVPVADRA